MRIPIEEVRLGDVFLDCGTEYTVDSIARHGGGIVSFSGTAQDGRRVSRRFARGSVASFVRRGPEPVVKLNHDEGVRLTQELGVVVHNMRETILHYKGDNERLKKVVDAKNELLEKRSTYISEITDKYNAAQDQRDEYFQRLGEMESNVLTLRAVVHDTRRKLDESNEVIALLRQEIGKRAESVPPARHYTTIDRSVAWEVRPDFSGEVFYKDGANATYPEGTFHYSSLGTTTLPEVTAGEFLQIVNSWRKPDGKQA